MGCVLFTSFQADPDKVNSEIQRIIDAEDTDSEEEEFGKADEVTPKDNGRDTEEFEGADGGSSGNIKGNGLEF